MMRYIGLTATTVAGVSALVVVPDKELVANVILAGTVTASWAFVILYVTRSRWRAEATGRAILRMVLSIALICTQGLVTILTDYSYPGREIIRPILLLLVGVAVLDLLWTLVRIQRGEDMYQPIGHWRNKWHR
jgi:hypothetical protein